MTSISPYPITKIKMTNHGMMRNFNKYDKNKDTTLRLNLKLVS